MNSSTHPQGTPQESSINLLQELRKNRRQRSGFSYAHWGSAWEAIWSHRGRSFLTILSIVVGMISVISALTMTSEVSLYENNLISQSLGANTILVQGSVPQNLTVAVNQSPQPFTLRDWQSLQKIPHIMALSPGNADNALVIYNNLHWNTHISGANQDIQSIKNLQIVQGTWYSDTQDASGVMVAVLGDTVFQELFAKSGQNPIGQQIRLNNQLFRVTGVLAPQRKSGDSDNVIFIPFKTYQARMTNQPVFKYFYIQVDTRDNIDPVVQSLTTLLEDNHHLPKGSPDDFQISTSVQYLQFINQLMSNLTLLFSGIAAISLTIGGIGIMNMMLITVTERTREIGLRIAIGGRQSDIRTQFLIEALIISLVGGIIGMVLGLGLGWLLARVIINSIGGDSSTIPLTISTNTLWLPLAISIAIGVLFGLYPATQAACLNPIEALRARES